MSKNFKMNYMPNCIHLEACRRLQNIAKEQGKQIARHCNRDCSCYEIEGDIDFDMFDNGESYVTVDEAISYARNGVSSIRSGYGAYDVYCSCDLRGQTIPEIILEKFSDEP